MLGDEGFNFEHVIQRKNNPTRLMLNVGWFQNNINRKILYILIRNKNSLCRLEFYSQISSVTLPTVDVAHSIFNFAAPRIHETLDKPTVPSPAPGL